MSPLSLFLSHIHMLTSLAPVLYPPISARSRLRVTFELNIRDVSFMPVQVTFEKFQTQYWPKLKKLRSREMAEGPNKEANLFWQFNDL